MNIIEGLMNLVNRRDPERKIDYDSLQGLETSEGEVLRELPSTRKVLPTKRGMGEVVVKKSGLIVGGKK